MKLIVGLGNPGQQYANNRHNVGFQIIDHFAARISVSVNKEKFGGVFYKNEQFILAKPLTYMNLSGDFVQAIMAFYKIKPEDVLVIYDDMDFPIGKGAMKPKGSAGGQNGIKDIIAKLGTGEVQRLKVGIGRPDHKMLAHEYVLANFSEAQQKQLHEALPLFLAAIDNFINRDFSYAAQVFNFAIQCKKLNA